MTPEDPAPVPRRIQLSAPGGVLIEWRDDHQSLYPYAELREACPCATCRNRPPRAVRADEPLPVLGREPTRPEDAELVGHYALRIYWNDGHSSGIYSFQLLRNLCLCEECREE